MPNGVYRSEYGREKAGTICDACQDQKSQWQDLFWTASLPSIQQRGRIVASPYGRCGGRPGKGYAKKRSGSFKRPHRLYDNGYAVTLLNSPGIHRRAVTHGKRGLFGIPRLHMVGFELMLSVPKHSEGAGWLFLEPRFEELSWVGIKLPLHRTCWVSDWVSHWFRCPHGPSFRNYEGTGPKWRHISVCICGRDCMDEISTCSKESYNELGGDHHWMCVRSRLLKRLRERFRPEKLYHVRAFLHAE